ncbi:MAG: lipopolysaccharide heptosyltransferase I [Gammaproteobacteria bacterium RIFCSPHIGHO2_12_FULL_37_14]|nr:MAG: lipopolysaccharide heptosyltransferase I [Gammaproteobacteria bacterium RIFCSPHIGHO2_12_FULL_37_14]
MRILLIKTSSMGDIIHTLPALTDAGLMIPEIKFDWVVEEPFAEIPAWHPLVDRIIPVALRRWRNKIFSRDTHAEWQQLREKLNQYPYDLILDAQGLVKSVWLSFLAKGPRAGLNWGSARERLASIVYQKKYKVNFYQHAVIRMRQLFSQALRYPLLNDAPNFGLNVGQFSSYPSTESYVVFLHGTTWATKEWPETYWVTLANKIKQAGYRIKISGGTADEVARAYRIAKQCDGVDVLPQLSIAKMAELLAQAKVAVAVDTGLGHLAAALGTPTVSIYGSTNPIYTGALGKHSAHLAAQFSCAPCLNRQCHYKKPSVVIPACYTSVSPPVVFTAVMNMIDR